MSPKLIGIVFVSVIGFAQAPAPATDPGDLWRKIRSALITTEGDNFFQQIFFCRSRTARSRQNRDSAVI